MSLLSPSPPQNLSSVRFVSGGSSSSDEIHLISRISQLSIRTKTMIPFPGTTIRMGGGPRTYPGGVSKWQWKRMQAKKAKQLLKARLCRERQIYEMRKRTELRAAVSELEKPWEVVERAPKLFSVSADEQLKALADRFQKPGGFDMWSERDGPQLFHPSDGLPSARFFPKGVVHSIKPYGIEEGTGVRRKSRSNSEGGHREGDNLLIKRDNRDLESSRSRGKGTVARNQESGNMGSSTKRVYPRGSFQNRGDGRSRGSTGSGRLSIRKSTTVSPNREEAYEMSLRPDGRYEVDAAGS